MVNRNKAYARIAVDGSAEYGPVPLKVAERHHEEWDEPVLDPETGEPTGETERRSREWDSEYTAVFPTAAEYLLMGYLPVRDAPPAEPAPSGFHYERAGWEVSNDGRSVSARYEAVLDTPPPPRRWSRLNLKTAFARAGMLDAVLAYLSGVEVAPGYTAEKALTDCDYIEEGFGGAEAWSSMLDGAAAALSKTREEIDAFLDTIPEEV